MDAALAEIARLPGRHLYFLDDHLFGNPRFARELFRGMRGMGRVFQGAATVDSILRDDVVEEAAAAGLRSLFVGFETLSPDGLAGAGKRQNLGRSYGDVVRRLDDLGIMINGSFVFGLDGDDRDVFRRTVDWAIHSGITTATFHILTPYPGTALFSEMAAQDRLVTRNWDLYDTRHVVYRPIGLSPEDLKRGYDWAYEAFYRWGSIFQAASAHAQREARAQARRLQRGLEEVRAGMERRHPDQTAVPDAADAGSRSLVRGRRLAFRHGDDRGGRLVASDRAQRSPA